MSKTVTPAGGEWRSSALCRKYLLVVLANVPTTVVEGEHVNGYVLRWGVGVLSDGEREFLGVWHEPDSKARVWRAIADDLKTRGVEDNRVVVGSDPTGIKGAMRASYPGVIAMPAIGDGLSIPLEHLGLIGVFALRHRSILRKAVGAIGRANEGLNRTVTRRGCFADLTTASSFVVNRIARAERDFSTFGVNAFGGPAHPAARAVEMSHSAPLGV